MKKEIKIVRHKKDDLLDDAVLKIKELMVQARKIIFRDITNQSLKTYWQVGQIIVEKEQDGKVKARYGDKLLIALSKKLTNQMGRGFSRSNLQNMRKFYVLYPKRQTVSGKLTWSHYVELLNIEDTDARSFYEKESINSNWSVRDLQRQIEISLFERLLLSNGKTNKQKVLELSNKGVELNKPEDILKTPMVFEFLGAKENKPLLEKELEYKLNTPH
ncbi:MAG: DUF1016 N-terminal domain-containing protein [Endomicrobium sp.]|jgi:hypothetical protein|nr:DUF1016 N-terminal domain-containing protein [Endomicrobium sp.]